jgi:hypothetical protein
VNGFSALDFEDLGDAFSARKVVVAGNSLVSRSSHWPVQGTVIVKTTVVYCTV